jgi:MFS family permease
LGLLLPEFPLEQRATATALWGAVGGIAAATGPSLGGLLIEWTDWRLVFFVNLVLGAAALVPARRLLVEIRDPDRGAVPDALGVALLASGVGAVSLGIVQAPDWGWSDTRILASFAAAVVLLGGFVWRSAAHPHPVLELSLFRVRSFATACAGVGVFALGFYALLLANILFLTSVWGYSVLKAGFAVTPGPLMAATSSALAGRIVDRYGQRVSALPGGLLFAAGCVLFASGLGGSPSYPAVFLPATLLTGMGVGLSFAGWSSAAVAGLPPARFATGSAISSCFRQLGAVLGISVLIALIGSTPGLSEFHRAYWLMAVTGLTAGLIALSLRRVRATVPAWTSKSAPSTTPSPERAPSAARS